MRNSCPKICGRLVTAALLISIAIVQIIAGMLLLRSKYIYMLSIPNFWTAVANISVGSMLGISAGVWKDTSKSTQKHKIRRNVLSALTGSAVILNGMTAWILIMGEGNAHLSIQLENDEQLSSVTVAGEILAYAFAASVSSPVICIVICLTYLSGICFRSNTDSKSSHHKRILRSSDSYDWVFEKKHGSLPKPDREIMQKALAKKFSLSSGKDSSSSSDSPCRENNLSATALLNTAQKCQRLKLNTSTSPKFISEYPMNSGCNIHVPQRSRVFFADDLYRHYYELTTDQNLHLPTNSVGDENELTRELSPSSKLMKCQDGYPLFEPHKIQCHRGREYKRKLLKDHPAFKDIEDWNVNNTSRDLNSSPRPKSCLKQTRKENHQIVDRDVHQKYEFEVIPKETIVFEADVSLTDHCCDKEPFNQSSKIQRTSTCNNLKMLMNNSSLDQDQVTHKKALETLSSTISYSPDVLHMSVSEKELDNGIFEICNEAAVGEFRNRLTDSDFNATLDTSMESCLAGEVVAVQLDEYHSSKFNSKLVPVSVPVIPDQSYKSIGISKEKLRQSMRKLAKDNDAMRSASFSSFHTENRLKDAGTRRMSINDQKPSALTLCKNEGLSESFHTPSAHTSGYGSVFEESVQSLGRQNRENVEGHKLREMTLLDTLKGKIDESLISELIKDALFQRVLKESLKDEIV